MFDETTETTEDTESKINPICIVAGSAIATYAGYRIWKAIRNRRNQTVVVETVVVEEQPVPQKETAGSKS